MSDCAICDSKLKKQLESVKLCKDPQTCKCSISFAPNNIHPMCKACRKLLTFYLDHRSNTDALILDAVEQDDDSTLFAQNLFKSSRDITKILLNKLADEDIASSVETADVDDEDDEDEDDEDEDDEDDDDDEEDEDEDEDEDRPHFGPFEAVRGSAPSGRRDRIPQDLHEFIDICIGWCDANPRLLKEIRAVNVSFFIEKGLLARYDCRYCRRTGKRYNGHPWGQCPNYHRAMSSSSRRFQSSYY